MKHSKFFYLIILSALFLIVSCHNNVERQIVKIEDNSLIVKLHSKDIQIRELDFKTDTVNLENYDKIHKKKHLSYLPIIK
jgi:type III secretory pathway lipoprotein EscJ